MALAIVAGAAAVAAHLWLIREAVLSARRWLSPVVVGLAVILVFALHGAGLRRLAGRLRPTHTPTPTPTMPATASTRH